MYIFTFVNVYIAIAPRRFQPPLFMHTCKCAGLITCIKCWVKVTPILIQDGGFSCVYNILDTYIPFSPIHQSSMYAMYDMI